VRSRLFCVCVYLWICLPCRRKHAASSKLIWFSPPPFTLCPPLSRSPFASHRWLSCLRILSPCCLPLGFYLLLADTWRPAASSPPAPVLCHTPISHHVFQQSLNLSVLISGTALPLPATYFLTNGSILHPPLFPALSISSPLSILLGFCKTGPEVVIKVPQDDSKSKCTFRCVIPLPGPFPGRPLWGPPFLYI
jgi:hypothetical protein